MTRVGRGKEDAEYDYPPLNICLVNQGGRKDRARRKRGGWWEGSVVSLEIGQVSVS